jgi:cell division GTPase FtsZ
MPDGGLSPCVIKVVGVGGGGSNAVDRMMETRVEGVEVRRGAKGLRGVKGLRGAKRRAKKGHLWDRGAKSAVHHRF